MKNDKGFRKKKAAELKAAYWTRQEEKIKSKQAAPRSFKILVGGQKQVSKKKENRRAEKKNRLRFL